MFIPTPKVLAEHLISQRKRLKLSQTAVAQRIGLKQQTISEFEKNPESSKVSTLFRILSAIELDFYVTPKSKTHESSGWTEEW